MTKEIHADPKACRRALDSISDSLYVIGGKWKLPVIVALREGYTRFNDIQRAIEGISAKVLSGELKELELNGFVKRTVHTQTPVVVEYQLTEYADTLKDVLFSLAEWGTMHRDKLKKER
jgi:DNA-binding HxlR family transcriptional regulator